MSGNAASACVVGSGPNGLAAAVALAQAGLRVDVFEAESIPGGAARTMELTLPGFLHDFGSAVHPLGIGSPFFSSLPLQDYGLEWIHSPAPLAHPLDDGTAVVLERDLDQAASALGEDGRTWRRMVQPFVEHWSEFAREVLRPQPSIPSHPLLMARFGINAPLSARTIAQRFRSERTRALFAGVAAHSFLSLEEPLSGVFGLMMVIPAHAVGWPIPRGGSQSLTNALIRYLEKLGGRVTTSSRIESLNTLSEYDLVLCDVTPRQLLSIAADRLTRPYVRQLQKFRYGPGAFKVDYALSAPIPWKAGECARAATVHLGGSFEEIAASEKTTRHGQQAERPFLIVVQPSLFDSSRAAAGKHTAWAYCHVLNGSTFDMLPRLEAQIERFAPGFRDCVLARRVLPPADLERMDSNLVGGDVQGGVLDIRQFLFRPTWQHYRVATVGDSSADPHSAVSPGASSRSTRPQKVYLCSASTPPGGGVHGMCGYHAAKTALADLKRR
jgi:phytoene dehydrogenase-like protein